MYHYHSIIFGLVLLCITPFNHAQVLNSAAAADGSPTDPNSIRSQNTYDFIVVGVGAAGSVICGRLIQNPAGYTVFGIEAGNRTHRSLNGTDYVTSSFSQDANGKIIVNTPFTRFDVPTFWPSTYLPPTPYEDWQAVRNGVLSTAFVAKLLGGSSTHNAMVWSRETQAQINAMGVSGWSWSDVLPFYKKSENATGTRGAQYPSYHGFDGPIGLTDVPQNATYYEAVQPIIDACVKTGLPYNPDFNGPNRLGCGAQQYSIENGIRSSSANEYLPQAAVTGRLHLSLDSTANKVIFERCSDGTLRAIGVEYVHNGTVRRAYARKDVIVSLSAVFTPKLLQLSGIGPSTLLNRYGIPVLVNNPYVGRNLSNNQYITGAWEYPNATLPNGFRVSSDTQEYALYQTGILSFPGFFASIYACTTTPCDPLGPDVLISTGAGIFLPPSSVPSISYDVTLATAKSRGIVSIASANPSDPPIIDMPVWQNEADLNATIAGFMLARKIKNNCPILGKEISPGPSVQTYAQYRAFVLANGIPNAHYSGTARIGNYGDPTAVTDPRMAVVGVKGLRIGDTSVIHSSNSHTQATAVMCGERAAAFSLQDAAAGNNCNC